MTRLRQQFKLGAVILTAILSCTGCSTTLIKDPTERSITGTSRCTGAEWTDNSSLAIVPVPVLAFFLPRKDINEIKADDYLKRCGESTQLINRQLTVDRGACIPTSLTYLVTLGIWQWCPAQVEWQADVQR